MREPGLGTEEASCLPWRYCSISWTTWVAGTVNSSSPRDAGGGGCLASGRAAVVRVGFMPVRAVGDGRDRRWRKAFLSLSRVDWQGGLAVRGEGALEHWSTGAEGARPGGTFCPPTFFESLLLPPPSAIPPPQRCFSSSSSSSAAVAVVVRGGECTPCGGCGSGSGCLWTRSRCRARAP